VGQGRVAETELMLKLVVGDTERCWGGKLKSGKGILKPNPELRLNLVVVSIGMQFGLTELN
jgi:hypothetical protein